jgi:FlaA1/EpsC-like NDP-sugar epimerase
MTRFAVTLDTAVDTLISLFQFGRQGEIFVPHARGMRIDTLAECLAGDCKIPIIETGLRPGEKLHESLVNEDELPLTSVRSGYYVIAPMFERSQEALYKALERPLRSDQQLLSHSELEKMLRRHRLIEGARGKRISAVTN